mmetsp:Transcript_6846/g.10064  ORF Transcript_6846/g.10064 Transcript_6846/m.10064 type:complete len:215 (-) Transcript_6846:284-928(-)|eukprot:CAMPEP_0196816722 /NCGR_PEP_ID=MMETSP1362-20130617/56861_1 /TAXON_ID=163516 /ORGANISM="Leptocylindrus danicus, Strain CCMP1856" /LENGTH=214 /DNA_ID=CAMNT_0042194167 /DNA_START=63 /DNA_END=707 /DNA_ORIENTATION=+
MVRSDDGHLRQRTQQANAKRKQKENKRNQASKLQNFLPAKGCKVVIYTEPQASNCPVTCCDFFFRGKCTKKKCKSSHEMSLLDQVNGKNAGGACEAAMKGYDAKEPLQVECMEYDPKVVKVARDSIVYIVLDGELVFDRFQGGALVEPPSKAANSNKKKQGGDNKAKDNATDDKNEGEKKNNEENKEVGEDSKGEVDPDDENSQECVGEQQKCG